MSLQKRSGTEAKHNQYSQLIQPIPQNDTSNYFDLTNRVYLKQNGE